MTTQPEAVFETDTDQTAYTHNNSLLNETFPDSMNGSTRVFVHTRMRPTLDTLTLHLFLFQYYGYPVILAIGTIGNVLAYLVFTHTRLKKVSSSHYLAAIAITDTGFLWTSFLVHMYAFYKVPIIVQDGVCQFMTFLNYVFTFLSIWYLVAVVVDKFIAIYFPLKKSTMCTPFRAKLVMSFMAVWAVACYSYVVYFFGPDKVNGRLQCMPWKELQVHFNNLSKIDTVVIAIVPYGIIILLVTMVLIRTCEYFFTSTPMDISSYLSHNGRAATRYIIPVTNIVFPIVILTVITNLPVMVLRAAMTLHAVISPIIQKWNPLFYVVYIMNFAVKYFIYMTFSAGFRRLCLRLLKAGYRKTKLACKRGTASEQDPRRIVMEPVPDAKSNGNKVVRTDI